MRLSKEAEKAVKKPLGILFRGKMPAPYERFKREYANAQVIAVGDVVTTQLLKVGIVPILSIYDGRTKRACYDASPFSRADSDQIVENPQSTISRELWDAIKFSDFKNRKLFIDGEEDLASLPAILYAPLGAIVVYGQPDEGIVIVHVTEEKKEEIHSIIAMMEGEKWI